jgi:hypothetical protein
VVRFFERTIITKIARLVGGSGGSGGQDYINARVMLANPTSKTEAVHSAAEANLRKDNVDLLRGTQYGHDVSGGAALENRVPAIAQIAGYDDPNKDVRFNDQDRAWFGAINALVV